jgi:hypothetical protein
MKVWAGALALVAMTGFGVTFAQAEDPQANVGGIVQDASKNAVSGADVTLLGTDGTEVASATTAADGTYSFGCVTPGDYRLQIASKGDLQGQKVEAPVGPNGLNVAWAMDAGKPALASATATGGACGAVVAAAAPAAAAPAAAGGTLLGATGGAIVGGGAVLAGAGVGIAAGAGAFQPDSPAQ